MAAQKVAATSLEDISHIIICALREKLNAEEKSKLKASSKIWEDICTREENQNACQDKLNKALDSVFSQRQDGTLQIAIKRGDNVVLVMKTTQGKYSVASSRYEDDEMSPKPTLSRNIDDLQEVDNIHAVINLVVGRLNDTPGLIEPIIYVRPPIIAEQPAHRNFVLAHNMACPAVVKSTITSLFHGGANKIYILNRHRNIITKGRVKYVRYKNELITLKEAKKLEKSIQKKKN